MIDCQYDWSTKTPAERAPQVAPSEKSPSSRSRNLVAAALDPDEEAGCDVLRLVGLVLALLEELVEADAAVELNLAKAATLRFVVPATLLVAMCLGRSRRGRRRGPRRWPGAGPGRRARTRGRFVRQ